MNLTAVEILLVLLIMLGTTFVRAAMGFGNALIAMPLLILLVGVQTAAPLVGLLGLLIAVLMLMGTWRKIVFEDAWRLVLSTLVGIPVGLFFLTSAPEGYVRMVLGVVLIAFGLFNLFGLRLPRIQRQDFALIFGFFAGILGGAYNSNGPPVVIYGVMRDWPPEKFRATLQGYFLVTAAGIVSGQGISGLWTGEVLQLVLISLPAVVLGVGLGRWAARRIPADRFDRLLYGFLVLVGTLMFL
mgnify:FL=1